MRAIITPDPQRGAGHARILLEGCSALPGGVYTLRRGSDMKFLAASGWQESECPLAPDDIDSASGGLCLLVGPDVVDQLDALSAYQIGADGQRFGVEIRQLVYSRDRDGGGAMPDMPQAAPVSAPAPDPKPAPQPQPAPEPEPAPQPVPGPQPEPIPAPEPEPTPAPQPGPQELTLQEVPARPKSRLPLVLALLLLLLIVAGGAAWYFLIHQRPDVPPVPPVPAQTESAPAAPAPAAPSPAPTAPTALETARKHLRGPADPAASLALAKPLRTPEAGPEESDAAFLLLEDAAQKGNAEAMWLVGQFYDPATTLPRGSIPADMSLARQWYEKARAAGVAQAEAALKALRAHVEAEASKGDMEAKMLLQNWK